MASVLAFIFTEIVFAYIKRNCSNKWNLSELYEYVCMRVCVCVCEGMCKVYVYTYIYSIWCRYLMKRDFLLNVTLY